MDETGQPGAAAPGENADGAGSHGDLVHPADGWSEADGAWSGVVSRFGRRPSALPAALPLRQVRPPVNGTHLGERTAVMPSPESAPEPESRPQVSAPPYPHDGDRQEGPQQRMIVPAPRPSGDRPGPQHPDQAGTGQQPPRPSWAGEPGQSDAARHAFDDAGAGGSGPALPWRDRTPPVPASGPPLAGSGPVSGPPSGSGTPPGFRPASGYGPAAPYEPAAAYEPAPSYEPNPSYEPTRPYESGGYETPGGYEPPANYEAGYEPTAYEPTAYEPTAQDGGGGSDHARSGGSPRSPEQPWSLERRSPERRARDGEQSGPRLLRSVPNPDEQSAPRAGTDATGPAGPGGPVGPGTHAAAAGSGSGPGGGRDAGDWSSSWGPPWASERTEPSQSGPGPHSGPGPRSPQSGPALHSPQSGPASHTSQPGPGPTAGSMSSMPPISPPGRYAPPTASAAEPGGYPSGYPDQQPYRPYGGYPPPPAGDPLTAPRPGDPAAEALPQRVPAEPDVPVVPESPSADLPAETPELARIATHLRREDATPEITERPEGFDVNAILAAVRGVAGVRDAALRKTPAGAHSLRLELSDGADPAEVSRHVARLLQERMGLAAAPQDLSGANGAVRSEPTWNRRSGGDTEIPPDVPRRRRQATVPRGRAPVEDRSAPAPAQVPTPAPLAPAAVPVPAQPGPEPDPGAPSGLLGSSGASPLTAGTSYSGGQLTTTESAPSRPLNPGGPPGPRVVIDHVQVSTFGLDATVEVQIGAGEQQASGLATGPAVDGYVLRLCAVAAAAAIDKLLHSSSAGSPGRGRCFVEHAAVIPFGSCEVATVVVLLVCDGWVEQLAGSALVSGDPRQAVVRAALAAVNRRLEALLA